MIDAVPPSDMAVDDIKLLEFDWSNGKRDTAIKA